MWLGKRDPENIESWVILKAALLSTNKDWTVWTDWYESRVAGESDDQTLELGRANISEEIWDNGPRWVNSRIETLISSLTNSADRVETETLGALEIPSLRPAAVEPVWQGGKLSLPLEPAKTDLSQAAFANALSALRTTAKDLAQEAREEANIDRRFIAFMDQLVSAIPLAPPARHDLFRLGHLQEVLAGYAQTVTAEWPVLLAAKYHALNLQFDRTMRQSPEWRAFKQNAEESNLTREQIFEIGPAAQKAADALRHEDALEFVDALIPQSLDVLSRGLPPSNEFPPRVESGLRDLGADLLEGLNNVFKMVSEQALRFLESDAAASLYLRGLRTGFKTAAVESGPKDGKKLFKWLRWAFLGAAAKMTGIPAAAVAFLITQFPAYFAWLKPVLDFLHEHLP